jgi:hypothetical protein
MKDREWSEMDASTVIQLITLVSVVIGVIGLLISVRAYKRQVNAYFLLEYTRRFDEAIQSLPLRVTAPHLFPNEALPGSSDELRRGILRCLILVSQLYYFSHRGYIPRSIWRRSEGNFGQLLRSPLFVREWKNLAPTFATDDSFCRHVEKSQQTENAAAGFGCNREIQPNYHHRAWESAVGSQLFRHPTTPSISQQILVNDGASLYLLPTALVFSTANSFTPIIVLELVHLSLGVNLIACSCG